MYGCGAAVATWCAAGSLVELARPALEPETAAVHLQQTYQAMAAIAVTYPLSLLGGARSGATTSPTYRHNDCDTVEQARDVPSMERLAILQQLAQALHEYLSQGCSAVVARRYGRGMDGMATVSGHEKPPSAGDFQDYSLEFASAARRVVQKLARKYDSCAQGAAGEDENHFQHGQGTLGSEVGHVA